MTYACANASVYFTDKSSGPITSRLWNFGDTGSAENTSTLTNPQHFFGNGGPFSVSLQVIGTGGTKILTKPVTLAPNTLPSNSVQTQSNGDLISTVISSSYQWLNNGQLIPSATSRTYKATAASNYSVLIFNTTCNRRSDVITALEDQLSDPDAGIKVYPNPTSDFLQIQSADPIQTISILDAVGREWIVEMESMRESLYRVNVTFVPPGLYILKATTSRKTAFKKIIINK